MDPYIKHLNELVYTVQMLSEELEIAYDIMDSLFEDEDYELKEEVLLEKKKWIQDAIKKEGSLRKTMKTKEGKNIPVSKLEKAAEKGGKTGKRARLALTLRKLSKNKKLNEDRAELERAAMNPSGARTPRPTTQQERLEYSGGAWGDKLPPIPPISSEMSELERAAMNPSGAQTPRASTQRERRLLRASPKHGGVGGVRLPPIPPISSEMEELERAAMNPSGAPTPEPTTIRERSVRARLEREARERNRNQ
jgi:hypothetical protein